MGIKVSLDPPRVYICGHRVHHGLVGFLLVLHDLKDAPRWLPDLIRIVKP